MPAPLTPQQFVAKWRSVTLKERSAVQEHFLDAYGWPHDLADEEILSRLLALNLQRSHSVG